MENSVLLQWKSFSIPVERLQIALKGILGDNFDGIVCSPDDFYVVFKTGPAQNEIDTLISYWDNVTADQFSPTLRETISDAINNASMFGRSLILDAAVENVEMGITQAGKTRDVADYCADVQRYLESGSLYAAVSKIDDLINAGVPSDLNPFITVDRLNDYKTKINTYLGA